MWWMDGLTDGWTDGWTERGICSWVHATKNSSTIQVPSKPFKENQEWIWMCFWKLKPPFMVTFYLVLVKIVCRKILVYKSCCPEENHNQEVWLKPSLIPTQYNNTLLCLLWLMWGPVAKRQSGKRIGWYQPNPTKSLLVWTVIKRQPNWVVSKDRFHHLLLRLASDHQ